MLKHSQIDFSIVREIYDKISIDDYRQSSADEFPQVEQKVAVLALIEQQVLSVALHIRAEFAARGLVEGLAVVMEQIKDVYVELDEQSKHMLLPLFFTGDMSDDNTTTIPKKEERDAALMVFIDMINRDNLALDELKKDFVREYPLGYLLPLYGHLEKGDKASEPVSLEELNIDPEYKDDRNAPGRVALLFYRLIAVTAAWGVIFFLTLEKTIVQIPGAMIFFLAIGLGIWIWYGLGAWWERKY